MSHFNRPVGIQAASSIGGGQYTLNLFFEDATQAKYMRVNDTLEDSVNNKYQIDTWVGTPSDFVSGQQVTLTFLDTDTIPVNDAGFDSLAYTAGQLNYEPELRVTGTIGGVTLYSGQTFEYNLSASWNDLVEAANAVVGDSIVDDEGKEYEITFLDTGLFDDPFRVTEKEKVGAAPSDGAAVLYRGTPNFEFFQGTGLPSIALDNIRNRDNVIIDNSLGLGGSGNGDWVKVEHTITAGELAAKQFTIVPTPLVPSEVLVHVIDGPVLDFGTDYTISGSTFSWNALAIDGIVEENDKIELAYFS